MTESRQVAHLTTRYLQRAILLAGLYVVLIFLLPASRETMRAYHLSAFEYRIILLAVTLPQLVAWLVAFEGYARLRQYVYAIRKTREGVHFDKLATGSAWLAWSLPLPVILALLLNALASSWTALYPASIIIGNYFNLLLPLVAFSLIGTASRGLVSHVKIRFSLANIRTIMLVFLVGGVSYCYLTFKHFDPGSLGSTHNPYFLPIWLMVLSVIIPYLYAWFAGLLAACEITLFSQHTTGVLYRQALHLLAIGLVVIIVSSIALQYMNSVQPLVGHLVIDYQLVLASIFRIIDAGGFVLLAAGASRLKKIEEV
jgi:hypothetical protein